MTAADSGITVATWCLVGVTGSLVVVTTVLAVSTWRMAKRADEATEAANRTAAAAESDLAQGNTLIKIGQEQVNAAQEQASAALAALRADLRPMLVPTNRPGPDIAYFDVEGNESGRVELHDGAQWWKAGPRDLTWLAVKVRNIGRGPALVGRDVTDVFLRPIYGGDVFGWIDSLVIAQNDDVWVAFVDKRTPEEDSGCLAAMLRLVDSGQVYEGNKITVVIRYSDVSGETWTKSHLRFLLRPEGRLEQRKVELEEA